MNLDEILHMLNDVPDYEDFLFVDELNASTHQLAASNPDLVELLTIGASRRGEAIEAIKLGDGPKTALVFGMPHPNEPIGSMMLDFFSRRLAEDDELRKALGYTWYLVKCIDPDGTRLNEGWFKAPFSLENYARSYYRPPAHQQVAWTFPIDYKTLHFNEPIPETKALMGLIKKVRPDFMYSLHNSDFGGVYYFLWEHAPPLYDQFHQLVESQGLPLHKGEPERPYEEEFAPAIYRDSSIAEEYDYLKKHTSTDPAEIISGGTLSFEYARRFCDPFSLICELPYFSHPAIGDISPSDTERHYARFRSIAERRASVQFLAETHDSIKQDLTVQSPFRDAIEETLRTAEEELAVEERWLETTPSTDARATVAEKFDNLLIPRFNQLTTLGMFMRMIRMQIEETGESLVLKAALRKVADEFDELAAALEAETDYSVIPVRKLVRVQLGSGLLAANYVANQRED
jgi:hypothetical protein